MSQSRRLRQKNENTFCRPPDFHYLCMTKQTMAMRIHHFNPEHEICLASGRSNYTPPHAATRLRSGLGWMPALWAEKGDIVLVDDSEYAKKAAQRWRGVLPEVHYLTFSELKSMLRHISMDTLQLTVSPWGWDLPLRQQLMRSGVPASHLPTLKEMDTIRTLAHRRSTIPLLRHLVERLPGTVGERQCHTDLAEVEQALQHRGALVLKSPWSSSGRGVRYVSGELDPAIRRWAEGVIARQGSIITEPCYDRAMDFALEYEIGYGQEARFLGFSLFDTRSGSYQGNWLATEARKRERLLRYMDNDLLTLLIDEVGTSCTTLLSGRYTGPFGVDMMVVRHADGAGHSIHPCVELNLRRTMGHVALHLTPSPTTPEGVLYITQGANAELKVEREKPFVKVI